MDDERFCYLVTAARGRSKQTWELHCADETLVISFAEGYSRAVCARADLRQ